MNHYSRLRLLQRQSTFLSSTRRQYTDAALLWAQANPQQAQACLQPPPPPTTTTTTLATITATTRPQNWSEFWEWRHWNIHSSKQQQALVSHVLTGPLTLAQAYPDEVQQWTCLGARAESMLPVLYWKELLYYNYYYNYNYCKDERHRSLSFVGPECVILPTQQLSYDNQSMTVEWTFRGKYHETMSQDNTNISNGFVLFNPGFGHAHLRNDWKPTLDLLWSNTTGKRHFLLTAHSAEDAERDWKLWHSFDSTLPLYEENQWASEITYADPLDPSHIVQPNLFVCHHVLE